MSEFEFKPEPLISPKRIDAYLAEVLRGKFSREEIKRSLNHGLVRLDGKTAKPSLLVKGGEVIRGKIAAAEALRLDPESTPLQVLYEDESLLVIDKAAGMVVHPGSGNKKGTLVNALLGRGQALSSVGDAWRPGIVHRLDKGTSGILLVAKDNVAHRALQEQFALRSVVKIYTALVHGRVEFEEGRVLKSIARDKKIREKMAVSEHEDAKEAETRYQVLKRFAHHTLLKVRIFTGRTHQIRVHLTHIGHPVVGDKVYGKKDPTSRLGLHSSEIEFTHPKTGKPMKFESPLPEDFSKLLQSI